MFHEGIICMSSSAFFLFFRKLSQNNSAVNFFQNSFPIVSSVEHEPKNEVIIVAR